MDFNNLVSSPSPILAPHVVFQNENLLLIRPAQNAAQYLTAVIVNLPEKLQAPVRTLRNNFEDTIGGALAKISDKGRMLPEQELRLATLIILQAQEIANKLASIPNMEQHIPRYFQGHFVSLPSQHRTMDVLSSTYGGVIGGGIGGARRIQKKIPAEVQKQLGEIDIIL